jgi:two-component system chemotaxis response regulator CheB
MAAMFCSHHIGPYLSVLPRLLSGSGQHTAIFAQDGTPIEAGHIHVVPPDHHMLLGSTGIRLSQGQKLHPALLHGSVVWRRGVEGIGGRARS